MSRVSEAIQKCIDNNDISRTNLAVACCISKSALVKLLNDNQKLSVEIAIRLGKALNLDPMHLLRLRFQDDEEELLDNFLKEYSFIQKLL